MVTSEQTREKDAKTYLPVLPAGATRGDELVSHVTGQEK